MVLQGTDHQPPVSRAPGGPGQPRPGPVVVGAGDPRSQQVSAAGGVKNGLKTRFLSTGGGIGARRGLARIPAGLAIVVPLVAIGYTIVCAVSVFAAPAFIDDSNVNIPPGLSRAGFENWARDRAVPVICSLPYNGHIPGNVACAGPPGWSKSAVTPAQPAPAALEALAIKIAKQDYSGQNGYTSIFRDPSVSLMIKAGLWIELDAAVGFILGLGLASLMGQRTGPIILIIVFQIILMPILAGVAIPHLQDLQRSVVGLAVARLEPSGLPRAARLPGVTGGVGG